MPKEEDSSEEDEQHRKVSFSASSAQIAPSSIVRVPTSGTPLRSIQHRLYEDEQPDHPHHASMPQSMFGLTETDDEKYHSTGITVPPETTPVTTVTQSESNGKSAESRVEAEHHSTKAPVSNAASGSPPPRHKVTHFADEEDQLEQENKSKTPKVTAYSPPPIYRKITPRSQPGAPFIHLSQVSPNPTSSIRSDYGNNNEQAKNERNRTSVGEVEQNHAQGVREASGQQNREGEHSEQSHLHGATAVKRAEPTVPVVPSGNDSNKRNRENSEENLKESGSSSEGGLHLRGHRESSTSVSSAPKIKIGHEIACQVEEEELLAKTVATQVNESELIMAPTARSAQDDQRSENDGFDENYLRPVPSRGELHGILRKTPSAKWGSTSTVCFDEHNGYDRSRSTSLDTGPGDMRANRLSEINLSSGMPRSESHNNLKSKHRNGSIGKKLAMFHLGHHDDNVSLKEPTPSETGSASTINKHASFAELPLAETSRKASIPFWRKLFPKKKEMTRSFTMEDLKKDLQMDDHIIPVEELFNKLDVDPKTGLNDDEAAKRLARDGKNMLTPPKKVPEIVKLLHEFVGGFSPLLEVGAILCFIAYGIEKGISGDSASNDNLYLGIVLICVVLITSFFLYSQKAKSEKIMEGFAKLLPQSAHVVRGGQTRAIPADELVMGDIVELRGGDRIPADIRILEASSLKVDNSSLTGEAEPQSRKPEATENPLESKNLAFYTTNCVEGFGKGVVVRRGDATVMGRIAKLTTRIATTETTIAREMRHFVMLICIFAIIMGVLCIIVALAMGYPGFYAVILAIGLVVANVPEGIIITVTVMLTLTAKRMAKKNCLIKNLEAVETLGACSVICSDKTGTLTQNRMTVAHCWLDDQIIETDTTTEDLAGKNLPENDTMTDLIRVATLCNRAKFKPDQMEKPIYARECVGDASETALLKFTQIITGDVLAYREKHKAVAEIPFNSTTKYQVSVHEREIEGGQKGYVVEMKGAPERIWDRCGTIISQGKEYKKDKNWDDKFNEAYITLGGMGERVLGFCDLILPADKYPYPTKFDAEDPNFPLDGLRFVGLISLIDPPRAAVPDGVAKCRSAGIQVIMVTGDHPVTAKAIARSVGIISDGCETVEDIAQRTRVNVKDVNPRDANAIVIHGGDLRDMKDSEIDAVLRNHTEIVFARTSPQQKLIIVEACQRAGNIVAVTGDGVNDSPALKKADIGIAMGITGSDVSKQAADIVLLDDNFASIVTGIEEGRLIFDNLKKTICYTLMSNIPEIAPVVMYFLLSIPLGLQTIPMLLICLGTDMIPSISMAHETAEADIMKLPPRSPKERLVSMKLIHCTYLQAGMIAAAGAFFAYFVVLGTCGFWPSRVFGLRAEWEDPMVMDLEDSYGQEWNYHQRMMLQRTVEAAFFAAVVIFQWLDLICRKVRRKSVFQKGMRNWFLNFALVFETAVTAFCIYVPGLNYALSLNSIRFIWWLPVIPFAIYFFVFDELRRYMIRRYPNGWMEREFLF
ncbi:Sodium/potassium-transporting ATPase subunit alpha [Hypsibius exemplaris]|uniref:Na(+)/K(+)-exchanging ATPase n=1 Tax=Hypsibius exemplaris TaxID=2072580 RepID=A0A1W0WT80_HYPEX|nr:Sodium/potassium-transporting ATPase subunit alpha [Hypsibius exemplaris]